MSNLSDHADFASAPKNELSGSVAVYDLPKIPTAAPENSADFIAADAHDASDRVLSGLSAILWREHIDPRDAEKLADLAGNRIIVLVPRGPAGISYAALLSLFLALLFEALLAGLFVFILLWQAAHHQGSRGGALAIAGDQATAAGGIIQSASANGRKSTRVNANWKLQPFPQPPVLEPNKSNASALADANLLNPSRNSVPAEHLIGLRGPGPVWTGQIPAAVAAHIPHASPVLPVQVPALPTVRSRGPKPTLADHTRSRNGVDPNEGFGSPFSLLKPGYSPSTGDDGAGQGRGRGLSAFNDPQPQVLKHPDPVIPLKYQLQPPPHSPVLRITVLPNGRAGAIRVIHSSGVKAVDQACADAVGLWTFFPAIKDGKKVVSHFTVKFPVHGY